MPGKRYTTLAGPRKSTSRSVKPYRNAGKLTERAYWAKTFLVWAVVFACVAPIFRSGLKTNLTLLSWIRNHTIWGDKVEFIPEEDYSTAFERQ